MESQSITNGADEQNSHSKASSHISSISLGYIFLFVSLVMYAACEYFEVKDSLFMVFVLHYFIDITYTIILIYDHAYGIRRSWRKENIATTVIAMNLYLISAYALNREIPVFANSTDWFCVYLMLTSATLLSFRYIDRLPQWVNKIQYFLLGCAIVLYLYLAIYVANFYLIGTVGILVLGIGLHILVPVTLLITCIFLCKHHLTKQAYYWSGAGALAIICAASAFTFVWHSRITSIERFTNQSVLYDDMELPAWVSVAQHIDNDWISERILKSDLVYTVSNDHFSDWDFTPEIVSWDERKKHDPLVFIGSHFAKSSLSDEDRVKILKAVSPGRHKANERLWSGDNLTTSYIVSDVDIYPELRLAYTEKYLNVKNNSAKGRWQGNTEEGIYTFYLPEGSVITSLSLWIEGKESKGILTSKQKAAKAYKTIVGVERRDPSVVHWQEGNTVTVRVFPCTTSEERRFKIGITSPLIEQNGRTIYKNIIFDGPNTLYARETKRVRIIGLTKDLKLPGDFEKNIKGDYISEQKYDPDFQLSFESVPLPVNRFTFDGFVYSFSNYKPALQAFNCEKIFLDINNSWTRDELDALKPLLDTQTIYFYADETLVALDGKNWDDMTREARKRNFTVFPFHNVKDPAHSIVVTKGRAMSPHLSDFSESRFADNVSKFFVSGQKINVFNLEGGSSTYINSLRELRGLEFAIGSTSELVKLLADKKFPIADETNEKINLYDAKMIITKKTSDVPLLADNAPDHLARLFAYNDVMRKVGTHYLDHNYVNEELVAEAAKAYVVSPVSSLIVLESHNDYKRFGIEDAENSLGNATKQSSGAVPEPHEWALIILLVLFVMYLRFKQ